MSKTKSPKISVIIPVYNDERLISRALKSVPRAEDIEVIIVDDGSVDCTGCAIGVELAQMEYKENCKYLRLEQNEGVANAMNRGFDFASGEYIVSLSSDDYYLVDFDQFRPYLDGKNDLVYFDLEVNDGSVWHLDEKSKEEFVGAVKFIRREFLGDTRVPNKKWHEDIPFSQELQKKQPKEVFTGIVLKHYNFPREGSLSWQANHQKTEQMHPKSRIS